MSRVGSKTRQCLEYRRRTEPMSVPDCRVKVPKVPRCIERYLRSVAPHSAPPRRAPLCPMSV
jgi:hypothetical protein